MGIGDFISLDFMGRNAVYTDITSPQSSGSKGDSYQEENFVIVVAHASYTNLHVMWSKHHNRMHISIEEWVTLIDDILGFDSSPVLMSCRTHISPSIWAAEKRGLWTGGCFHPSCPAHRPDEVDREQQAQCAQRPHIPPGRLWLTPLCSPYFVASASQYYLVLG